MYVFFLSTKPSQFFLPCSPWRIKQNVYIFARKKVAKDKDIFIYSSTFLCVMFLFFFRGNLRSFLELHDIYPFYLSQCLNIVWKKGFHFHPSFDEKLKILLLITHEKNSCERGKIYEQTMRHFSFTFTLEKVLCCRIFVSSWVFSAFVFWGAKIELKLEIINL